MEDTPPKKTDHDLLIEVSTMLKYAVKQVEGLTTELKRQSDNKVSHSDFNKKTDDHETRIRRIESWQENATGRNAVVSAVITVLVTIIVSILKIKI